MTRNHPPATVVFVRRTLAYHPLPQVVSGLCRIFFRGWPLFAGLLARAFFNALSGRAPAGPTVGGIVALVVGLALVRIGFVFLDVIVAMAAGYRVKMLLRRNLLARILERPGARPFAGSLGETLSTLRDDVDGMWGAGWTFDVVGFLVFALGGIGILLSVNAMVTDLVFLPIVAVLGHVARARLRQTREASRAATAQLTGTLGEVFGAVQAIQVAGDEDSADALEFLDIAGLTARFPESGRGVENVSFQIERGSGTVVTGRIGSGKTTLRENLLLGLPDTFPIDGAVQDAVLDRDLASFPDGLDTTVGVRGVKLSGGQVQRAAIARMLVRTPELLVLDDVSSALDAETERLLWQRIFAIAATCLVTAHRRAVLERADRILVLDDGRLVAVGTLAELEKTGLGIG